MVPPWLCSRWWWRGRARMSPWTAAKTTEETSRQQTSAGWSWITAIPCSRKQESVEEKHLGEKERTDWLTFYSLHSKHFTQVLFLICFICRYRRVHFFVFHSKLKECFCRCSNFFQMCLFLVLLFFFFFLFVSFFSLIQKIISNNIKNHVSTPLFSELEVLQFLMNYAVSISAVI